MYKGGKGAAPLGKGREMKRARRHLKGRQEVEQEQFQEKGQLMIEVTSADMLLHVIHEHTCQSWTMPGPPCRHQGG